MFKIVLRSTNYGRRSRRSVLPAVSVEPSGGGGVSARRRLRSRASTANGTILKKWMRPITIFKQLTGPTMVFTIMKGAHNVYNYAITSVWADEYVYCRCIARRFPEFLRSLECSDVRFSERTLPWNALDDRTTMT